MAASQQKEIQQQVKLHRKQKKPTVHPQRQTLLMSPPLRVRRQSLLRMKQPQEEALMQLLRIPLRQALIQLLRMPLRQALMQLLRIPLRQALMQLLRMPLRQVPLKRLRKNPVNLCRKSP